MLLTEPALNPRALRERMVQLMFESLGAPRSEVLSSYASSEDRWFKACSHGYLQQFRFMAVGNEALNSWSYVAEQA